MVYYEKTSEDPMEAFLGDLIIFGFFALPVGAAIWFVVSLVGFLRSKSQRGEQPERYRKWRVSLVASAVVAGVLVTLFVGILLLLAAAVAHM